MTTDDKELVRRFQRNDPGAFERIYSAYGQRVHRFCNRICANATDAEDLTQEVFVAAYQGADKFEARCSLATWLYRIALYRRRGLTARQRPVQPLQEHTATTPNPADASLARISLDAAIAQLSDTQREAFVLVKAEGLTYKQAAKVLGVPQGTVQYRVHEAMRALRGLLADTEQPEPAPHGKEEPSHAMP